MLPQDEATFKMMGVELPLSPTTLEFYKQLHEQSDGAPLIAAVAQLLPLLGAIADKKCNCKCTPPPAKAKAK